MSLAFIWRENAMDGEILRDSEEMILHLRRIRLDLEGWATKSLAREGSNLSQYTVLAILDEQGELTMGTLAQHLCTTMGAVTNLVDKLVAAGRADRARSEDDRRVVRVKALPAGRELVARVTRDTAQFLAGTFGDVPAEQRKIIVSVLGRMAGAMRPPSGASRKG
jgi:DNA-binding MarR family transcriptional regulator